MNIDEANNHATIEPMSDQRLLVLMLCRSMLMFVHWANKHYRLGLKIK